jgi:hypothetical protein
MFSSLSVVVSATIVFSSSLVCWAQSPAHPVAGGVGQCVPKQDQGQPPFIYIGQVTLSKGGGHGTGTLIGPRHILTAAHVIEDVFSRQSAGNEPVFVVPGGRPCLIVNAEIDRSYTLTNIELKRFMNENDLPVRSQISFV